MQTKLLQTLIAGVAFATASCGGSADNSSGSTELSPSGGSRASSNGGSGVGTIAAAGSVHIGGTPATENGGSGGNPVTSRGGTESAAGTTSGNTTAEGGVASGGESPTSGAAAGGSAIGGRSASSGGATLGGAATGGKSASGGAATGGAATGGRSAPPGGAAGSGATAGGAATGGASTTVGVAGGVVSTGGVATGGATTTSTAGSGPCSATNRLSGGTSHCSQSESGSYGSYQWQVWSNQTAGCLTTYDNAGGAFSANWASSGDFLARVGLLFDGTKTYGELGIISADFAETHTGTAGAYSYIGVYGWTITPSVEFYIVEDSFDNSPPAKPSGGSKLGTIQVDGGAYDVFYSQGYGNLPSYELYSIRQIARNCGHISVSDQFSKWANLGWSLGKVDEVRIFVEAGGGTGNIDFTTASVVVN